jgi:pyruvate/2-oxoglutarate dehydrogenase complex dihydrolipoamide acyltransferase (E2) component
MPFFYYMPMPDLGIENSGKYPTVLTKHLVRNNTWVEEDMPIAVIESGGSCYEILTAGSGILHKYLRNEGSVVKQGDPIAEIHADGESIPYDKPYSRGRRV